jgi:hypothetical protein
MYSIVFLSKEIKVNLQVFYEEAKLPDQNRLSSGVGIPYPTPFQLQPSSPIVVQYLKSCEVITTVIRAAAYGEISTPHLLDVVVILPYHSE